MSLVDVIGKTLDFIRFRKRDYQLTFGGAAGQNVLRDLAHFCRASQSCFDPDARLHAVAEGRREVWLRIEQHLNLSSEDLFELLSGRTIKPRGD